MTAKRGDEKMEDEKTRNPKGAGRKRKLSPEQENHIYKLYQSGVSPEEIAYHNNISSSTLQRIIRRLRKEE